MHMNVHFVFRDGEKLAARQGYPDMCTCIYLLYLDGERLAAMLLNVWDTLAMGEWSYIL